MGSGCSANSAAAASVRPVSKMLRPTVSKFGKTKTDGSGMKRTPSVVGDGGDFGPFAASAASRSRELLRRRRGELRLELRGSTADKRDEPRATKTSTAEARSTVAW